MRKLIVIAFALMPIFGMAQSNWELPDASKQKVEKKVTDKKKDKDNKLDPKYNTGAISMVDGKVEWNHTIKLDGKSVEAIYESANAIIQELLKQPMQKPESRITAVNKAEHIIAAYMAEEMVFSNHLLSTDFCEFRYTLIATAKPGELQLRLCRISYLYDVGRKNEQVYTANEMITDEVALNSKKKKLYPTYGKFRIHTIDRKDEIFKFFDDGMK